MSDFFDFSNKKFLITGASSGMGRSTAIALARHGATLVITGRNESRLAETLELLDGNGHLMMPVDFSVADDLTTLFDYSISDGKLLDGIVHCAGIATIIPINMAKHQKVEECMKVNFFSFAEMVRLFSKRKYHSDKGSIVAVSSIVVKKPAKCQGVYAASKGAINSAVQAWAIELAEKNIRINCIMPASTDTAMMKNAFETMPTYEMERKSKDQLLGITMPEEIASYIMFLLSDASSAVSGREFYADGCLI